MSPRIHPFRQGFIKLIYKWFFLPLMIYKPQDYQIEGENVKNISDKEWLEYLFHTKERDIVQFRARVAFKLPGLFYASPYSKIQGIGYRHVKRGSILIVRKDIRESTYDVEYHGGKGQAEQVFQLSDDEWASIFMNLKEIPWRADVE